MPRTTSQTRRDDIHVLACQRADYPGYKFVVSGPQPGGRRWRKFFRTRALAEQFAHLRRVELTNGGMEGAALTQSQRAEYVDTIEKLAPFNIGLREAADLLLPMLKARRQTVPVQVAIAELLEAKKADNASRRYVEDLRSRLGQFSRVFGDRLLADVTGAEIDRWLRSLKVTGLTRNHFRRVIGTLCSFGLTRGWCLENPVTRLAKAKVVGGKIGILTPEQTAKLLEVAHEEIVAALAIGAFAGLRRAELERLDWREVHLAENLIEVRADKAKTARRRFIKVQPNLAEWLSPHVKDSGPVCPPKWLHFFKQARKDAGLAGAAWPDNALRHSFASYYAAHFRDAGQLAAEMGHTTPAIVFQHYRELVRPAEAARYWQIKPACASNVVMLRAAR